MENMTMLLDPKGVDAALDAPLSGKAGTVREALQAMSDDEARAAVEAAVSAYLTTAKPDLAKWLAHAERIMQEDDNLLRRLAK